MLFRASHHSGPLEVELTRRNIPFVKFGGLKFLEAAHIKDVLALLRWAENPRDRVAGFRVVQLLPGVGPGDGGRVLDRIGDSADPAEALSAFKPPAAAAEHWPAFVATLGCCAAARRAGRPSSIWCAAGTSRISSASTTTPLRQADLQQLAQIAATYPSRERFLTELTLDPPDATSDRAGAPLLDEDYLILSTIHSAKGQEWTSVYMLNAVDGCMPVRSRDRHQRRDRGGAAAALCGHDAGQGPSASDRAAALLRPRPAAQRRPPPLCVAHALHSFGAARPFRVPRLAAARRRRGGGQAGAGADRPARARAPELGVARV